MRRERRAMTDPSWHRCVLIVKELKSEAQARTEYDRAVRAHIAAGILRSSSLDREIQVRITRPKGWGHDGRARYGVWTREKSC